MINVRGTLSSLTFSQSGARGYYHVFTFRCAMAFFVLPFKRTHSCCLRSHWLFVKQNSTSAPGRNKHHRSCKCTHNLKKKKGKKPLAIILDRAAFVRNMQYFQVIFMHALFASYAK